MKRLGMKPGAVVYSSLMGVCSNVSIHAFNLTVQNNLGIQCLLHFMVAYAPPNSTKGVDDVLVWSKQYLRKANIVLICVTWSLDMLQSCSQIKCSFVHHWPCSWATVIVLKNCTRRYKQLDWDPQSPLSMPWWQLSVSFASASSVKRNWDWCWAFCFAGCCWMLSGNRQHGYSEFCRCATDVFSVDCYLQN